MKKNLNNKNFSKIKIILIISLLLFLYTITCCFTYVQAVSSDISNSVFRLHVVANSNSKEDQSLKYIVRDNLLNYMNNLCTNCSSKQEAIKIVKLHQKEFEQIAIDTIRKEGYSYEINTEIGNFYFPTKQYGDISLPAGSYDALNIKIGEGKGKNWWCVMFPSLCFVDISSGIVPEKSKESLQNILSDEEYSIISNDSNYSIKVKFKLIEFFANKGLLTAKT